MKVFYDGDCAFCADGVHRLLRALGLEAFAALPAQSDPSWLSLMERERSWLVVEDTGQVHTGYDAFLCLLACSPRYKKYAPILQNPFARGLGERVYRWVANHRPMVSYLYQRLFGLQSQTTKQEVSHDTHAD